MLKLRLRLVFLWQPVVSHAFEWKRDFSLQSLPSYAECTLPVSCSNNVSIPFNETPKSRKKNLLTSFAFFSICKVYAKIVQGNTLL